MRQMRQLCLGGEQEGLLEGRQSVQRLHGHNEESAVGFVAVGNADTGACVVSACPKIARGRRAAHHSGGGAGGALLRKGAAPHDVTDPSRHSASLAGRPAGVFLFLACNRLEPSTSQKHERMGMRAVP